MSDVVAFCRSRNDGRRCTRPLGHAGLHRHRSIMWTDAGADPAHCPGSGSPAEPAEPLPNGFPHGRALCPVCHRFVALDDGALVDHDTWDPGDQQDAADAREWLNTHGW